MKTNFAKFLAGRNVPDLAMDIGVTRQTIYDWIRGDKCPHPLRVPEVLAVLGKPWNRILKEEEVWPEGIDNKCGPKGSK